mgnify:CR=1 FL=1
MTTLFILGASSLQAQEAQKIAVLDLGNIYLNSLAMQNLEEQLKSAEAKIRADMKAKEAAFREEKQTLEQQRAILAPEQFKVKVKELTAKGLKYRNDFQGKIRQLAESRSASIREIETLLEPIVSDVANSVGATMIIEKQKILFGTKKLNISEEVTKRLNAKVKKLKLVLVPLKTEN